MSTTVLIPPFKPDLARKFRGESERRDAEALLKWTRDVQQAVATLQARVEALEAAQAMP